MGIPYAFQYYYNKYNCEKELMINIEQLINLNINHLFFDYNSLIHPCAQQILSINHDKYMMIENINDRTNKIETDIIQNCLDYTRFLINQVFLNKPISNYDRNVYIIIDGIAPRSKMNQQRERRYKSEFFKIADSNKSTLWDSNKITPGTNFMNKLKHSLINFSNTLKDENDITCIISDSNDIGEGEHKIMKIISQLKTNIRICIYGLDADLIMLSLLNINNDKIILIRDNSFNNNFTNAKKTIDYLNIKNLRTYIIDDILNLLNKYNTTTYTNIDSNNIINDYVFLCFLLGNDFLEHLPSLSIKKHGIDIIMKAYIYTWNGKHLINPLTTTNLSNLINLKYFKDIMYHLKNNEINFFKNFHLDTLSHNDMNHFEILSQNDNLIFYKDDLIHLQTDNYKQRYYMYYDIKNKDIDNLCLNYIEGLYWIFGYYNNHIHNNWTWYYKYHNVPFCSDIFEFLMHTNFNDIKNHIEISLKQSHTYTSLQQLFMVLPKTSLINILKEINYSIDKLEHTLLSAEKFYPSKIAIDLYNKKYLWQSKIFLHNIDENILDLFIT